jgi:hypothetical protein
MLIEVTETHPPKFGKKVATVVAADGEKFEIWPEKLAGLQVGTRYEIDVEERDYNGRTIRKITKATPANGAAKPVANGNGAPAPANGEPEFVATVLAALIMKGEVLNNKRQLFDATEMLRGCGARRSEAGPKTEGRHECDRADEPHPTPPTALGPASRGPRAANRGSHGCLSRPGGGHPPPGRDRPAGAPAAVRTNPRRSAAPPGRLEQQSAVQSDRVDESVRPSRHSRQMKRDRSTAEAHHHAADRPAGWNPHRSGTSPNWCRSTLIPNNRSGG